MFNPFLALISGCKYPISETQAGGPSPYVIGNYMLILQFEGTVQASGFCLETGKSFSKQK